MENKVLRYGSHHLGNDNDGYLYSFNTSKGYTFDSHIHKCYEIIHIISGQFIYTVEGHEYLISGGDIVMTNPDELHSFSFPEECEYQREFLHIYPGFLESAPESENMLRSRKIGTFNHIPHDKVEKYKLDKIFEAIREVCFNPIPETNMIVFANTLLFIAKTHRMLTDDAPEYSERVTSKANSIYDYIDHHYRENINSTSVAAAMFMSQSGAERLFKRETGMSIKSYITLRRITAAKNLMIEGFGAMNIFEQCGFHDYTTFYRAFIKYVGMTPDKFKHFHGTR